MRGRGAAPALTGLQRSPVTSQRTSSGVSLTSSARKLSFDWAFCAPLRTRASSAAETPAISSCAASAIASSTSSREYQTSRLPSEENYRIASR